MKKKPPYLKLVTEETSPEEVPLQDIYSMELEEFEQWDEHLEKTWETHFAMMEERRKQKINAIQKDTGIVVILARLFYIGMFIWIILGLMGKI